MKNWNFLQSIIFILLGLIVFFMIKEMSTEANEKDLQLDEVGAFSLRNSYSNDSINLDLGKQLFKVNCATCHNKNMKDDLTGPALQGTILRWQKDTLRIAEYIWNPQEYFSSCEDLRMKQLHEKFGSVPKPGFPNLSINDIRSILAYIDAVYYY